jgi:DNA repair ATPase RecN
VRADVSGYSNQLDKWIKEEARTPLDDDGRFERASLKSRLRQRISEAQRKLDELQKYLADEKTRLERIAGEVSRYKKRAAAHEKELQEVSERVSKLRATSRESVPTTALAPAKALGESRQAG